MSYRPDIKQLMDALLQQDANAWASLSGLMAVLALPAVRQPNGVYRRRDVEVEIAPGVWQAVDSIAVEAERLVFWFGPANARIEFVFLRVDGAVPRWRQAEQSTGVFA